MLQCFTLFLCLTLDSLNPCYDEHLASSKENREFAVLGKRSVLYNLLREQES